MFEARGDSFSQGMEGQVSGEEEEEGGREGG